jgi:hypothetical protein
MKDFFDMTSGSYTVMTEASIFPLTELVAPFPRQADLIMVNRFYVDIYHIE